MARRHAVSPLARPVKWVQYQLRRPPREVRHVLGIACTGHGASLAYVGREGLIRSSVLERWTGVKHVLMFAADEDANLREPQAPIDREIHQILSFSRGGFPPTMIFEETITPWFNWLLRDVSVRPADIDLVVTSDSHFATCELRLGRTLNRWFPAARVVRHIEHHEIHRRQAFWQSGFDEAAVLTLDSCGEDLDRLGGRKLAGTIARMDRRGQCEVLGEYSFPESSAGYIYDIVTGHLGFPQGDEGKTMGLAPYGGPDLFDRVRQHLELLDDGGFRFMPLSDFDALLQEYVPARSAGQDILDRHKHVAYAGQALLELIVTHAFETAMRRAGMRDLAFAGGVALNSVANDKAYRSARPRRLYVAPNPGDPGHALGCALYGAYEVAGWQAGGAEVPEYLGPPYTEADIEAVVRDTPYSRVRPESMEAVAARTIANGYILARFAGGAEFGPRALGNRSILCDPRRWDMKDYLNARVKHREPFRPFAPTVLEDRATEWFELDAHSPYMLRVVPVRPERRAQIPAVVHVDGTARVQTLAFDDNPGLWRIIDEFQRMTGVPMVLNTSFNLAGKPIVETPAHAVECFSSTELDLLAIGPFILSKQPLSEYLERKR
jgi:carbamoyltransferase